MLCTMVLVELYVKLAVCDMAILFVCVWIRAVLLRVFGCLVCPCLERFGVWASKQLRRSGPWIPYLAFT